MLIKYRILTFRNRILELHSERLTRKIYVWSISLADCGVLNWAERTRTLMNSLGDLEPPYGSETLWNALAQLELNQWNSAVKTIPRDSESGGRFRFYRTVKLAPAPEPYILSTTSHNKRCVLVMLRCGVLPLEVETGRYRSPKPPLVSRTCLLCNGETGDEVHFLNTCPSLSDQRSELYSAISALDQPNDESFF